MECPYCKKEFIQKYSWVKFCSNECRIKQRRIRDHEKKLIFDRNYYHSHKKEFATRSKIWRQKNKQRKYETDKVYRLSHIDKHNEQNRAWRKRHREENRQTQKNYYHKIAKHDINFKIARNKRALIRRALKLEKDTPESLKLLGCTISKYWTYLISKFTNGMTKKNYGILWCIDHIKPCSSFNLKNKKELLACFNYINTQPLTIEQNRQKGIKY